MMCVFGGARKLVYITRGVTYAKLTHTVAEGRYTTAPHLFPQAALIMIMIMIMMMIPT